MSTYKVIQDIEAEDKLVGPLTLRQFIYGCITGFFLYLSFLVVSQGFSIALIILMPPVLFTGFFAFPWSREQSTEVWALAKLRFILKSRKRIWNQSGAKDLVNVTAPKRDTKQYTNTLSNNEVQSRLNALASTLDTRGWAVKNVYSVPAPSSIELPSDRLIDANSMPRVVPDINLSPSEDILDEENNPRAQQLRQMVAAAEQAHKQALLQKMEGAGSIISPPIPSINSTDQRKGYWFMDPQFQSGAQSVAIPQQLYTTDISPIEEANLSKQLRAHHDQAAMQSASKHLKTIQPLSAKKTAQKIPLSQEPKVTAVTPAPRADTIRLAANKDLSVAALANIANRRDGDSGEVVISLHNR